MWKDYLDNRLKLHWMSDNFKSAYSNNPCYGPSNEYWGRHALAQVERERKAKGGSIYYLNGGVTEFLEDGELVRAAPPDWIVEEVKKGIGLAKGWDKKESELRQLIAEWYQRLYGFEIDGGSEVALVVGASFGTDAVARITAGPGDEVLIMDPDYVTYMPQVASTGATIVPVPLKEEKGEWHFSFEELEKRASPRSKLLMMSNANNPSGFFYTKNDLESIADLAKKYDFMVFHDQVSEEYILDKSSKLISLASLPEMKERTVIASSFSKMYQCGNFRTGWIVANKSFCEAALQYRAWSNDGIVKPAVDASLAVLKDEYKKERKKWVENKLDDLKKKRDNMKKKLSEIKGVVPNTCRGHYWAWPNVSSFGRTSQELAEYLLRDVGVYCRPGTWYGTNGEGHFRLNFSLPIEYMNEALDKMKTGLNKLPS